MKKPCYRQQISLMNNEEFQIIFEKGLFVAIS